MPYNPLAYWTENGKQGIEYDTPEHHELAKGLLEFLKTLDFKTVLEVGCGYGRITHLIQTNFKIDEYTGIDISLHQLKKAISWNRFDHILQADITNPTTIPKWLKCKRFDLVIAVNVLMHIKPEDIFNVIGTIIPLSSKHIVSLDHYPEKNDNEKLADHNFIHDYPYLYNLHSRYTEKIKLGRQCIFYCQK